MAGQRTLIAAGHVLSMDPAVGDLPVGDVLIEDDRILAVGPSMDGPSLDEVDEVVDAAGMLVLPGLFDTHLHLWQTPLRGMASGLWAREYFDVVHPMSTRYTPQDVYWSTYAGAVELLSHGVTSVVDYCHSTNSPEHAAASLRALTDAGIRGWFGFGMFEREGATYRDRAHRLDHFSDLFGESQQDGSEPGPLVSVAMAIDHDVKHDAVEAARAVGAPITIHGNPIGLISEYHRAGLLGADMLWVHCNAATDQELSLLAGANCSLSLSPDIEMGMGKPVEIFRRAQDHGVNACLSVDTVSYTAGDLFTQAHLAYNMQRVLDGQRERGHGHIPVLRTPDSPRLSARTVVEWMTINAARAVGRVNTQGSLAPGRAADLITLRTAPFGMSVGDPAAHVVLQAGAAEVDTVMVGGRFRKRAGQLCDVDTDLLTDELSRTRERLLGGHGFGLDITASEVRKG